MSIVLVIPDLHAPFQHPDAVPFLKHQYNKWGCNRVVCLGDEMDYHALSKYPKDPNGLGAGHEHQRGKEWLKRELYPAFPVIQICTSNHTSRYFRKAFEAGIPEEFLIPYKTALEAPDGYSWSDRIIIDNVLYMHGEGYSGPTGHVKAAKDNRMSTVIGHLHSNAGVQYFRGINDQIFAMNAGCLIDETQYPFRYGAKMANRPTLGCGIVAEGRYAFFVPMHKGGWKVRSVNVLGTVYKVKFVKALQDSSGKNLLGYCDLTAKEIIVVKDSEKLSTLLHEIIHAVWYESGLNQTDIPLNIQEIICEQVSRVLATNFRVSKR